MFDLPPNLPNGGGDFNLPTIIVGLVMSFWGGLVSFMLKFRAGLLRCSWRDFLFEITVCLFAGFVVFMIAVGVGVPVSVAGAFSGLGGHYGARTLFLLKKVLFSRAEAFIKKGE